MRRTLLPPAAPLSCRAIRRRSHPQGADVNGADACGRTAAHAATARCHVQVLRVLLRAGAQVASAFDLETGATPLHVAASLGHRTMLAVRACHKISMAFSVAASPDASHDALALAL